MARVRGRRRSTNLGLVRVNRVGLRVTSVTSSFLFWTVEWWKRGRS